MLTSRKNSSFDHQEKNGEIPAQHHCSIDCAWVNQPCSDSPPPMIEPSVMSTHAKYEAHQRRKIFRIHLVLPS